MGTKSYLITGGAGCIGAPLIKALLARGDKVTVLDDNSRGDALRLKGTTAEMWMGDIRHPRWVYEAVKNTRPNCVVHLAAVNGTRNFYDDPHRVLEVGVKGIVNVLDACIAHGVQEILIASSSEVYHDPDGFPTPETVPLTVPDPLNPRYSYSGSKILTELMILHYGWFTRRLIVRPHNVYGPDMNEDHVIPQFIRRMQGLPSEPVPLFPIQGTGEETRSFCHIDDAVSGIITVLDRGEDRGIYNVGTPNRIQIKTLAHQIAAVMGKLVWVQPSPGQTPRGSPHDRCPDVAKLMGLGWTPQVRFDEGLEQTVKWYLEHPAA